MGCSTEALPVIKNLIAGSILSVHRHKVLKWWKLTVVMIRSFGIKSTFLGLTKFLPWPSKVVKTYRYLFQNSKIFSLILRIFWWRKDFLVETILVGCLKTIPTKSPKNIRVFQSLVLTQSSWDRVHSLIFCFFLQINDYLYVFGDIFVLDMLKMKYRLLRNTCLAFFSPSMYY